MPTEYGSLTEDEIKNGWTLESLAAYHTDRARAEGRVARNVVTVHQRQRAPIRMESALKFNPHTWGR